MHLPSNKRRALVSGATGFIGAHVVDELLQAGHDVRVIGRRRSLQIPHEVEQFVIGDLTDPRAVEPALLGVDWMVHVAGLAHLTRDTSSDPLFSYRRANLATTVAFAEAAASSGVSVFVLLSSVAALENESEGSDTDGRRRAYSRSKWEAEIALLEAASDNRMRPIVIRAPMVYGPNMKGNPLRLFRLIERRVPLPLRGIENLRSSIYVRNLTAAVAYALQTEGVRGIVHVADAELISTPDFIRLSAESLGVSPRLFALPLSLLKVAGKIGDMANRVVTSPVTSEVIKRLTHSGVLDTGAPYTLAGFRPPFTAEAGIRATGQWFKGRHERQRPA